MTAYISANIGATNKLPSTDALHFGQRRGFGPHQDVIDIFSVTHKVLQVKCTVVTFLNKIKLVPKAALPNYLLLWIHRQASTPHCTKKMMAGSSRTLQRSLTISRLQRGIICLLIITASISNIFQFYRINNNVPKNALKLYGKKSKIQHLGNFSVDHPEPMFPSHAVADAMNKDICGFREEGAGSNESSALRPGFIVKYATLGGASYIMWLQLFIDSMQLFGILLEDIVVLSLDQKTTDHFKSHGITIIPYYRDQTYGTKCATESNFTAMRCQVSYGKAHVILEMLKEGYAVFFSDADVLYYKHPVQSLNVRNPNLDLYTQADHLDVKTFANFGVMLVYPGEMAKVSLAIG